MFEFCAVGDTSVSPIGKLDVFASIGLLLVIVASSVTGFGKLITICGIIYICLLIKCYRAIGTWIPPVLGPRGPYVEQRVLEKQEKIE
jgi:hypothetical protein